MYRAFTYIVLSSIVGGLIAHFIPGMMAATGIAVGAGVGVALEACRTRPGRTRDDPKATHSAR